MHIFATIAPPGGVHIFACPMSGQLSQVCAESVHIFAYYPRMRLTRIRNQPLLPYILPERSAVRVRVTWDAHSKVSHMCAIFIIISKHRTRTPRRARSASVATASEAALQHQWRSRRGLRHSHGHSTCSGGRQRLGRRSFCAALFGGG